VTLIVAPEGYLHQLPARGAGGLWRSRSTFVIQEPACRKLQTSAKSYTGSNRHVGGATRFRWVVVREQTAPRFVLKPSTALLRRSSAQQYGAQLLHEPSSRHSTSHCWWLSFWNHHKSLRSSFEFRSHQRLGCSMLGYVR